MSFVNQFYITVSPTSLPYSRRKRTAAPSRTARSEVRWIYGLSIFFGVYMRDNGDDCMVRRLFVVRLVWDTGMRWVVSSACSSICLWVLVGLQKFQMLTRGIRDFKQRSSVDMLSIADFSFDISGKKFFSISIRVFMVSRWTYRLRYSRCAIYCSLLL